MVRTIKGQIVLDGPVSLAEGAELSIEVLSEETRPTLAEQFAQCFGLANDLPSGMAQNHDHYLNGRPKR